MYEFKYNDFSYLGAMDNVEYSVDQRGTQCLVITNPGKFRVKVIIPDRIFEWFIDVIDDDNNSLATFWDDLYGEPKPILIAQRQKEIERDVQVLLTCSLRITDKKTFFKRVPVIEVFLDDTWKEFIEIRN